MAKKTAKAPTKAAPKKTPAKKKAAPKKAPVFDLKAQAKTDPKWKRVISIAAASERTGRPTRVVIECQENGPDCEDTREIATQDLFQVTTCEACRKVKTARVRRERKAAAKEAKKNG